MAAAERAGWEPRFVLRAGEDVEPELLDAVSALGSGSRVIGVYEQRWAAPGGDLSVWLHAVEDPGNVGTIIRSAHGLADGPVILGPGCADPFSPKAVRATMGSLFARPPARAALRGAPGARGARRPAADPLGELVRRRLVLCLGASARVAGRAGAADAVRIRRAGGPESLNVAMTAAIGLYEAANRMAGHG